MLLLALTGLGATSCSNDDLDGGQTGTTAGTRNEIQLQFSGTGESQEYTKASGIASESENQIDKLSVYLFASKDGADNSYVYLETWNEGTAYDPANPSTDFKLQASGTTKKASIYPNELEGLPYLKLFCVVNNGSVGNPTDGKFYDAANAEILQTLTPVTVDANGNVNNTPTTEADFQKSYTRFMQNAAGALDIINTPLLMTGSRQVKISGSVSKVDINLKRAVARFDIDNTTAKSQLTIQKISLAQARKSASLWGITPTAVADKDTELMTYAPVTYTDKANANAGLTESVLYVYPNIKEDESYLIIEGTYKSPVTTQQVPVTYHVPVAKTADTPGATAEFIPIKANSRYKLRITDVTQSNVYGTFEIEDWTSAGGITIKPDNDAPVFAGIAAFGGANTLKRLPNGTAEADTCKYEVEGAAGSFTVEIAATGKVRAEKASARTKAGLDWLTVNRQEPIEKDGVWYSKFDVTYTDAIGAEPVALTFINEAASFDPALWTILKFYGPKAVPAFAATAAPVISTGNKVDMTTPTAPKMSLYKINGSQAQIDVTCMEGVAIGSVPAGIEVIAPANNTSKTYTVKVKDAAAAAAGTIEFKNAGDESKVSSITLALADPGMTAELPATTYATMTGDATNGYEITVDLETLATNNFTFKMNSPEGLKAAPSLTSGWLTIADGNDWAVGNTFNTYTVTAQGSDYADTELTFVNKLDGTPNVKVTLKKGFSKVKMSVPGGEDNGKNPAVTITDAQNAMGSLYGAAGNGNQLQLTVASLDGVSSTATCSAGLTATQGANDQWTITTDGSKKSGTGTVVFASAKSGSTETATLTVTFVDPAVTAEIMNDSGATAELSGNTVYVDPTKFNTTQGAGFTLKVTALENSSVSTNATDSWASVTLVGGGTVASTNFKNCTINPNDDSKNADITITVRNIITGQDEAFTLKYQAKP